MGLSDEELEATKHHLRNILDQDVKIRAKLKKLSLMVQNLPEMVQNTCEEILTMKNSLLLGYLTSVAEVLAKKLSRNPIEGLAAIERATEYRVVFEQLKRHEKVLKNYLDQQMKHLKPKTAEEKEDSRLNVEELVPLNKNPTSKKGKKKKNTEELDNEDEDRFVPFTSDVSKKMADQKEEVPSDTDGESAKQSDADNDDDKDIPKNDDDDGLFKPIKINPTTFKESVRRHPKDEQKAARLKNRALHSSVLLELQREHSDAPTVIRENRDLYRHREDHAAAQRQKYEEETFTRIQVSKKEMNKARKLATVNTAHQIANFDSFLPFNDDANAEDLGNDRSAKKRKFSGKGKVKGKKKFKRKKH